MSTSVIAYPARGPFTPRFILPNETAQYGLPDANRQPNILSLIDGASSLIDTHCGRIDGEGNGSLVYSTYMERILMQSRNKNVTRVSFKPLTSVSASVVNTLLASANNVPSNAATHQPFKGGAASNPLLFTNYFYTGVQPNTISVNNVPGSTVSPFLGVSGRYGGTVRGPAYMTYPDMNFGLNPLSIATFWGGPVPWTAVDVTMIDFDKSTDEIWIPSSLWLAPYTEIVAVYNSGFDPLNMPRGIKQACAMLVRNFLSRGGGTTGLRSIVTAGTANISFTPDLIDTTIQRMLDPFISVIAY